MDSARVQDQSLELEVVLGLMRVPVTDQVPFAAVDRFAEKGEIIAVKDRDAAPSGDDGRESTVQRVSRFLDRSRSSWLYPSTLPRT